MACGSNTNRHFLLKMKFYWDTPRLSDYVLTVYDQFHATMAEKVFRTETAEPKILRTVPFQEKVCQPLTQMIIKAYVKQFTLK